jgi:large subunit ribosomal protein L29
MEIQEIRQLSIGEIQTEIDDAREELMHLRFQRATGELTDHNRLRITRRNIARLMTVLNELLREEQADVEGEA